MLRVTHLSGFNAGSAGAAGGGSGGTGAFGPTQAPVTKAGTAINPLTEGGGTSGMTAIVYVASPVNSGLAATPAGWTAVSTGTSAIGLSHGLYRRVLDGTEGSVTFLGTSGLIICAIWDGLGITPVFSQAASEIATQYVADQRKALAARTVPVAVIQFGGYKAQNTAETWVVMQDPVTKALIEDGHKYANIVGLSVGHEWAFYLTGETPPADLDCDVGGSSSAGIAISQIACVLQPTGGT